MEEIPTFLVAASVICSLTPDEIRRCRKSSSNFKDSRLNTLVERLCSGICAEVSVDRILRHLGYQRNWDSCEQQKLFALCFLLLHSKAWRSSANSRLLKQAICKQISLETVTSDPMLVFGTSPVFQKTGLDCNGTGFLVRYGRILGRLRKLKHLDRQRINLMHKLAQDIDKLEIGSMSNQIFNVSFEDIDAVQSHKLTLTQLKKTPKFRSLSTGHDGKHRRNSSNGGVGLDKEIISNVKLDAQYSASANSTFSEKLRSSVQLQELANSSKVDECMFWKWISKSIPPPECNVATPLVAVSQLSECAHIKSPHRTIDSDWVDEAIQAAVESYAFPQDLPPSVIDSSCNSKCMIDSGTVKEETGIGVDTATVSSSASNMIAVDSIPTALGNVRTSSPTERIKVMEKPATDDPSLKFTSASEEESTKLCHADFQHLSDEMQASVQMMGDLEEIVQNIFGHGLVTPDEMRRISFSVDKDIEQLFRNVDENEGLGKDEAAFAGIELPGASLGLHSTPQSRRNQRHGLVYAATTKSSTTAARSTTTVGDDSLLSEKSAAAPAHCSPRPDAGRRELQGSVHVKDPSSSTGAAEVLSGSNTSFSSGSKTTLSSSSSRMRNPKSQLLDRDMAIWKLRAKLNDLSYRSLQTQWEEEIPNNPYDEALAAMRELHKQVLHRAAAACESRCPFDILLT